MNAGILSQLGGLLGLSRRAPAAPAERVTLNPALPIVDPVPEAAPDWQKLDTRLHAAFPNAGTGEVVLLEGTYYLKRPLPVTRLPSGRVVWAWSTWWEPLAPLDPMVQAFREAKVTRYLGQVAAVRRAWPFAAPPGGLGVSVDEGEPGFTAAFRELDAGARLSQTLAPCQRLDIWVRATPEAWDELIARSADPACVRTAGALYLGCDAAGRHTYVRQCQIGRENPQFYLAHSGDE